MISLQNILYSVSPVFWQHGVWQQILR